MPLYTLRTTSGREDIVIDILETRIKAEALDIKSVFHPAEIKGYIFIEGSLGTIHRAIQGMMHVRGLIEKQIKLSEVQHFLEYKKARIKVGVEDIVEIIGGPFKGEKGKVKRVDSVKSEVTIELLEASIPIPVTIATEFVKVIKRSKRSEEEEKVVEEEKESDVSVFDELKSGATTIEPSAKEEQAATEAAAGKAEAVAPGEPKAEVKEAKEAAKEAEPTEKSAEKVEEGSEAEDVEPSAQSGEAEVGKEEGGGEGVGDDLLTELEKEERKKKKKFEEEEY